MIAIIAISVGFELNLENVLVYIFMFRLTVVLLFLLHMQPENIHQTEYCSIFPLDRA